MTVDKPVYHFHMFGKALTLDGAEAVQAVYGEWTRTGECVFYTDHDEKLAVSDNMVVSTSTMDQQIPGHLLAEDGVPVDPDGPSTRFPSCMNATVCLSTRWQQV